MLEHWDSPAVVLGKLATIAGLVSLNGFFVAAEFAIVKVRISQLEALATRGTRGPLLPGRWRSSRCLSFACQLGITLASLGLGWVGEPFLAQMLQPAFRATPTFPRLRSMTSVSFLLAFSVITFLHIVLGEQAPKILAIPQSGARFARGSSGRCRCFI